MDKNTPMTPADSYDMLYNPFCVNADEHGEEKNMVDDDRIMTPADSYDELYNPFCSNADELKEENKEADRHLSPVDSCGEKRLNRLVKVVAINEHKKMECLEMNIKPGKDIKFPISIYFFLKEILKNQYFLQKIGHSRLYITSHTGQFT
ncbi:hypothetical protein CHS0354_020986 [Potamilus streckersoni]|uniref:Uncharacterized protein n=1 Tax=Potamilus streckersoni TaxID=2493646 RepID=A0AAE0RUG0_9BIVA|nr:hypothetical protein CHS0354_020986 [Potamilus streckersoni]